MWLSVFLCLYLGSLAAGAALVHSSTVGARMSLEGRYDARVATASRFASSYVKDVFDRETSLAQRRLVGKVTQQSFIDLTEDQGFQAAVLIDERGLLLAVAPASPATVGTNLAGRYAHLDGALQGRPTVSGVVHSVADGRPVVGFAVPFDTPTGRRVFSGAYAAVGTPLQAYLTNAVSLPGSQAYLIDADGSVVNASSGPARLTLAESNPALAVGVETQTSGTVQVNGSPEYFSAAPVAGTPWRVVFAVPSSALYARLAGSGEWLPWAGLTAFALAGLLALAFVVRFMGGRHLLTDSEARLQAILGTAPDAFVGFNEAGLITDWNFAATALIGWQPGEVIGKSFRDVLVPPREHEAIRVGLTRLLQTGQRANADAPFATTVLHRDGHEVAIEFVMAPLQWGDGWRFHAFLRGIAPRLAAEQEMRSLAAIVASSDDAIYTCGNTGRIASWNQAAEDMFGYAAEEMLGQPAGRLLPSVHQAGVVLAIDRVSAGERVGHFETVHRRKDGSDLAVSLSMSPLHDAAGAVIGVSLSARDITVAQAHAQELSEAEERFRLAFDLVPAGMTLISLAPADSGRLVRTNATLCRLLGYTEAELQYLTLFDITHPEDREQPDPLNPDDWHADGVERLFTGGQRTARFEKRYVRSEGSVVWGLVNAAVVNGPDGHPRYAVTHIEDITTRRAESEQLRMLALSDPLTGLANRLLFQDRLNHAVQRAERHDRTLAVIYCDLDGFKPVNDQFGHAAGDEVLRDVARRLLDATRPSDTIARLGGDEFAVLCEDLADDSIALLIAERIRSSVEDVYLVSAGTVQIGCSIGLAAAAGSGIDPAALVERADRNMFADKRQRRAHHNATIALPS